jgi:predicted O-methyltransferase YrrM
MIITLKNIVKNILNILLKITEELRFFFLSPKKYLKKIFYNKVSDLNYNLNLFKFNKFDTDQIRNILKDNNKFFYDNNISWHYHLFAGLKKKIPGNILEIGTFEGDFANFLSSIFPESKITTVDLPSDHPIFINTYNRSNKKNYDFFLKKRKKNLNKSNIDFLEINSSNLKKKFEDNYFDIIWIDGDHKMPQIKNDILTSIQLVKINGVIACDDIIMNEFETDYVDNSSYRILKKLEEMKVLKNNFLIKRINKNNVFQKKYISFSYLLNKDINFVNLI